MAPKVINVERFPSLENGSRQNHLSFSERGRVHVGVARAKKYGRLSNWNPPGRWDWS